VTLGFVNHTAFVQQMHVHGHAMRLLHDLDDGWEPYWRDAVLVPEGKTKHAAFAPTSGNGRSNVSSRRQATGMATWFQVHVTINFGWPQALDEEADDHRMRDMFRHALVAEIVEMEIVACQSLQIGSSLRNEPHRVVAADVENVFLGSDFCRLSRIAT